MTSLAQPRHCRAFASEDATIGGGPAAEFGAFIAQQQKLWKEIVQQAKIKPD